MTKNDPPEEYADVVQKKRENHERIMSKPVENTWELDRKIYKQVSDTIRNKLGLSCAKLTPQLSPELAKLSTRTRLWLAIA